MARDRIEWGDTHCQTRGEVERPLTDVPQRRHTSAIAPTLRSVDMAKPLTRARQLLRANLTERQSARKASNGTESQRCRSKVPTLYPCNVVRKSFKMVIHDATPTEPTPMQHTKTDRRDVPKSQSCGVTRNKSVVNALDKPTKSTVDRQLRPSRTKRGRRPTAADSATSSLASVHIAMDARRSSIQREFKRYDAPLKERKKQMCQPETTKCIAMAGSNSFCKSKKSSDQRTGLQSSAMNCWPQSRQLTTTEASTRNRKTSKHENLEPVVEEVDMYERDRYARCHPKRMTEPIDFHLSRFNLTSPSFRAEAESVSDNVQVGRHDSCKKEKTENAIRATSEQAKNSISKLCDLAYLEKFRSHALYM